MIEKVDPLVLYVTVVNVTVNQIYRVTQPGDAFGNDRHPPRDGGTLFVFHKVFQIGLQQEVVGFRHYTFLCVGVNSVEESYAFMDKCHLVFIGRSEADGQRFRRTRLVPGIPVRHIKSGRDAQILNGVLVEEHTKKIYD